uniref:Uncharacterized protein n=1 Tax=Cajanus cajan TaxID=3821 RepID=A0A151SJS8_CAJCA|nr:hypothetical protein KK1_001219 [Cajanus cajan]
MQIEDYLYQKKPYQPLSGSKPEGMKDEDALGIIRLTLSSNVAFNITKEKTTTGLMVTLSNIGLFIIFFIHIRKSHHKISCGLLQC